MNGIWIRLKWDNNWFVQKSWCHLILRRNENQFELKVRLCPGAACFDRLSQLGWASWLQPAPEHQVWLQPADLTSHTNSPASADLTDAFLLPAPRWARRLVTPGPLLAGVSPHVPVTRSPLLTHSCLVPGSDYCEVCTTDMHSNTLHDGPGPAGSPGVQWAGGGTPL